MSKCRGKKKNRLEQSGLTEVSVGPVADLKITKVQSPFILLKSCALALMVLEKWKRKIPIDGSNKKDSMDR